MSRSLSARIFRRSLPPSCRRNTSYFAVYVSSGLSYRESARRAGFHEDNGFRLTKMPAVRARIEELVSEPTERIRAGIDAEMLILRNRAANEDLDAEGRANVELQLKPPSRMRNCAAGSWTRSRLPARGWISARSIALTCKPCLIAS